MGLAKTEEFTVKQNRISAFAQALAHPARIAILELLLKKQACVCGDIADQLPLSQSTVSQHLKELKKAGLIQGDIDGVSVCYCINEKVWKEARQSVASLLELPVAGPGCC